MIKFLKKIWNHLNYNIVFSEPNKDTILIYDKKSLTETDDQSIIFKTLRDAANNLDNDKHDKIASRVFRRLRLRYTQLLKGEREAAEFALHKEYVRRYDQHFTPTGTENKFSNSSSTSTKSKGVAKFTQNANENDRINSENGNHDIISPTQRAYHLAVTDLFVEKALDYLEEQARPYKRAGYWANGFAILAISVGTSIAIRQADLFRSPDINYLKELYALELPWQHLVMAFMKAFTAYGMIVLIAVGFWRFGKAMLDQSERLMERRHALRQGRLFVHLNDGRLNIDDLEKAFNWNSSQSNAFGSMSTEAHAPWGAITKEIAQASADLLKLAGQIKKTTKPEHEAD